MVCELNRSAIPHLNDCAKAIADGIVMEGLGSIGTRADHLVLSLRKSSWILTFQVDSAFFPSGVAL